MSCHLPLARFLLALFLNPEVAGSKFLRNIHELVPDYMALYPKRQSLLTRRYKNLNSNTGQEATVLSTKKKQKSFSYFICSLSLLRPIAA